MSQALEKEIRILTIEDDTTVRLSIRAHLEDNGYEVFEAENGERGIEVYQTENPDAVLVDLNMPGINGIEVIKRIRNQNRTVPLIVVSGTSEIQSAINAIHQGACDYILKPLSEMNILTASIEKCLKRSRKRKAEILYRQHLEEELKRKSEEIERRKDLIANFNDRVKKIINSSASVSTANKFRDFSNQILKDFGTHLSATGGSIYIREEHGLRLVNSIEPKHAPDFITFPLKKGSPFSKVLESGKPILVNNMDSEVDLVSSGWNGYSDSSFMIFPLPDHNSNVVGLLSLHNKKEPPFVSEDKEIGKLMSTLYQEAVRSVNSMEALQLSESRLNSLTENSEAIVFSYSIETQLFSFLNGVFERVTGFNRSDILGKNIKNFVQHLGILDTEDFISNFEGLITGRSSGSGVRYRIVTSEGQKKWFFQKAVSIPNAEGFPIMIDGIITEFTEQKDIEEQLQALIDQKDLLLNEINHRVKNNMQIISSLINLQADRHDDEQGKRTLRATDDRIATLALVHDNIYDTELSPSIRMANYIEKLIANLSNSRKPSGIEVRVHIDEIVIDLDRAVLCGLIINEAVCNAFIHAFKGHTTGSVDISFKSEDDKYIIKIEDDGRGYNPEDRNRVGLGIDIIKSLVIQLQGIIEIRNDSGTAVLISFPAYNSFQRKEIK